MDAPTTPPPPPPPTEAVGPLRQLAPAARLRWRATGVLTGVVLALLAGGALVPLSLAGAVPRSVLWVLPTLVLLVGGIGWWHAGARYRRFGYRLDERVLHVRDGVLTHRDAHVPLFRVQHVDLARGPLQLLFGLTTLVVHTAAPAADVQLPDVLAADAEDLRDSILDAAHEAAAALGTADVDAV